MRALQIRRKVTAEIFKEAMRKGKFGITYATNLTNRLGPFIDYVMVEAAAMKRFLEFSESTFNFRAKTVIQDSNVVPLIRWLKHNSVSYPKIGKLICMSRGKIESIRRVVEWLKSIRVKGEFLGVALTKAGENILERNNDELDEIIDYLECNGVRKDWIGYVVSRCPPLLSYSLEEVRARVQFYLDMGMSEKDFGTMVFGYPRALGQFTMEEMNEKVSYLKEFGLCTEEVGKLLAFKPHLMGCGVEETWKPLVKQPLCQRYSLTGYILYVLGHCCKSDIITEVIFLMTKAGVSEKDIGKVIALTPELLGCSIVKKLEVNVKYFVSLGIRVRQLGEMIADFPMLLQYNPDILRPNYRYLQRTMVCPLQDLIEFPRHKILVERRINLKRRYMLASTDEEFEKKVEAIVERHQRFEADLVDDDNLSDSQATEALVDSISPSGSGAVYSLLQPNTPHNSRVLPTPSPRATQMSTLLCPLYVLHGKPEDNEEEKIIMHVLEIWRKVTAEIFKEAMRKGKFGITYATNLTYRFGPFIDYVIVEAAAMKQKRFPEFSESMFNFRAKAVIQDLNVVPLIRSTTACFYLTECSSFYAKKGLTFDNFGLPNPTQPPAVGNSGRSNRKKIILAAVFGGIGFVLLVLLLLCTHKRGATNQGGVGLGPVPAKGSAPPPGLVINFSSLGDTFAYQQLLQATVDFSVTNLIKHGHSGDLFRGVLENGIDVVIQRIDLRAIKKENIPSGIGFL
ncbi:hypothetical protein FH972_004998 [Carpinus fangiana]|uniref:Uncharacterized protein n=1 Tax=Carpinus fangiana TaxID=176857 RepID=A0A5N6QRC9_9ROSI|nr:hypothetical protein FH972_004998 [Carpinus fangiana]